MTLHTNGVPIPVALKCGTCGGTKPVEAFPKMAAGLYGRYAWCKRCYAKYHAKYYAENRERKAKYNTKYYAENRERIAEYSTKYHARWYAKNRERNADRVQDPNVTKACRTCGEVLPETSFSLNRTQPDGLQRKCKDCDNSAYRKACRSLHGAPETTTCHLCGLPNDANAWADHLIPQSYQGSDEGPNLHWSHPRCNMVRSNRPLAAEQIARLPESCTYTPYEETS